MRSLTLLFFGAALAGCGAEFEAPDATTRGLLAAAAVERKTTAPVMIAARSGKTSVVCKVITQIGGEVISKIDPIGYVRAVVPLTKVYWLLSQPSVEDLVYDEASEPVEHEATVAAVGCPGPQGADAYQTAHAFERTRATTEWPFARASRTISPVPKTLG